MKKILVLVILSLIYCLNVSAAEKNIDILEKEFIDCADSWEKHEQKCPESSYSFIICISDSSQSI